MDDIIEDLIGGSMSLDDIIGPTPQPPQNSVSSGSKKFLKYLVAQEYAREARKERRKDFFKGVGHSLKRSAVYIALLGTLASGYIAGVASRPSTNTDALIAERDSLEQVISHKSEDVDILRSAQATQDAMWDSIAFTVNDTDMSTEYKQLLVENAVLRKQQSVVLEGNQSHTYPPILALDTLDVPLGEYVVEVNKPEQRFRVWQRTNYALVADVPCSTGANRGEKSHQGDKKTPAGYFTINSVQNSKGWVHDGRYAYGDHFARLNFGSWNGSGSYNKNGHCSIGIHGTDMVNLLGLEDSEGCIRLPNDFLVSSVNDDIIAPGVQGFIVPYSNNALLGSESGVGMDRLRNYSENSVSTLLKKKNNLGSDDGARVISKKSGEISGKETYQR